VYCFRGSPQGRLHREPVQHYGGLIERCPGLDYHITRRTPRSSGGSLDEAYRHWRRPRQHCPHCLTPSQTTYGIGDTTRRLANDALAILVWSDKAYTAANIAMNACLCVVMLPSGHLAYWLNFCFTCYLKQCRRRRYIREALLWPIRNFGFRLQALMMVWSSSGWTEALWHDSSYTAARLITGPTHMYRPNKLYTVSEIPPIGELDPPGMQVVHGRTGVSGYYNLLLSLRDAWLVAAPLSCCSCHTWSYQYG
jgi:hypothetical protein